MPDKPPFEWGNYDLSRDYDRLLSTIRSGVAVVAMIDDDGLTRVVQCVAFDDMVDFRTQGVSYLTLFDNQMGRFGDWCERLKVGWFVPCHEPAQDHFREVTQKVEPAQVADTEECCVWEQNPDGYWNSDKCGICWEFQEGGPAQNGCDFCPRCGHKIKIAPQKRGEENGRRE